MNELNYGDTVLWNGKTVKCVAKHAQGTWHTYHFDDGSSFNGDANSMFSSGELKRIEPPTIKITNRIRPWTPKTIGGDENGKTSES